MATTLAEIRLNQDGVAEALGDVLESLSSNNGEVALDFSAVHRIDPAAVRALEDLAQAAPNRPAKVVLRGVNIDVYRVLKLMKLTPRFTFLS